MLIMVLKVNLVYGVNFAGVNFLTLIDAQGGVTEGTYELRRFLPNKSPH